MKNWSIETIEPLNGYYSLEEYLDHNDMYHSMDYVAAYLSKLYPRGEDLLIHYVLVTPSLEKVIGEIIESFICEESGWEEYVKDVIYDGNSEGVDFDLEKKIMMESGEIVRAGRYLFYNID